MISDDHFLQPACRGCNDLRRSPMITQKFPRTHLLPTKGKHDEFIALEHTRKAAKCKQQDTYVPQPVLQWPATTIFVQVCLLHSSTHAPCSFRSLGAFTREGAPSSPVRKHFQQPKSKKKKSTLHEFIAKAVCYPIYCTVLSSVRAVSVGFWTLFLIFQHLKF